MAQEQAPLNVKTLTEIMGLGSAILETDDGLANYLFPSEESNAPRITQDIVQQISAQQSLQDRVNRAFLQVMKSYGFYRYRVKPLRIRLRPAQPRKKDPARALLTASNHHHDRIARILSLLRLLGLEEEARAFYETLSSADRITETVSEASKTQWSRAMSEHVSVFVAEAPPVQTLSGEEASFLERLLRDGEARFGKRKRSTDVPDDGDASPATKKRNMDAGIWNQVRPWLDGYRRQSTDNSGNSEHGNASPESTVQSSPSWKAILDERMDMYRTWRELEVPNDDEIRTPKNIKGYSKIPYNNTEVVRAIGTIWQPLLNIRPFAFGEDILFDIRDQIHRNTLSSTACGQRHKQFIIPLNLESDAQRESNEKTKVKLLSHLVLAVATKVVDDLSNIEIKIYDSLPTFGDLDRIEAAAQAVVRYSGWLPMNLEPAKPVERNFVPVQQRVQTPVQNGAFACGLHVVLVAWALMLGIPVHPDTRRRNRENFSDRDFQTLGQEIVNRAILGQMDSRTIQAFLNASGMSEEQDVEDESIRVPYVLATAIPDVPTLLTFVEGEQDLDDVWRCTQLP